MQKLFVIASLFAFIACNSKTEKIEEKNIPANVATGFTYSDTFNQSVKSLMTAYFQLKDAFVASDTVKVNASGLQFKSLLDSLNLSEVNKADSLGFQSVSGRPGDAASEITGMLGEKDLDKKRESFEMISNVMYDLIRVIKPKGEKVYYQFCPMAFDNKGAYWLSNTDSIRNPYFGNKMLTCGETKETLNF